MRKAQIHFLPDGNRAWMIYGTSNIKISYSWWFGEKVHVEVKAVRIQETVQLIMKNKALLKS